MLLSKQSSTFLICSFFLVLVDHGLPSSVPTLFSARSDFASVTMIHKPSIVITNLFVARQTEIGSNKKKSHVEMAVQRCRQSDRFCSPRAPDLPANPTDTEFYHGTYCWSNLETAKSFRYGESILLDSIAFALLKKMHQLLSAVKGLLRSLAETLE